MNLRQWWSAARPRTLPAAISPVLIGTGFAIAEGQFHAAAATAAMFGALLLQVGTNFANDYFDFQKGADDEHRLGPPRATQQGWLTAATMRTAFVVTFALAAAAGGYLMLRGGWPIAVIGSTGIACGILYTGGPRPLGYLGLGDVLVLVYFGPVAVAGTHYVQALHWNPAAAVAGLGPGLLATGLLTVNNLRDRETDARADKCTLAVRFGRRFAKVEFVTALLGAAVVPVVLWLAFDGPALGLAATFLCLLAIPAARRVLAAQAGDRLLGALAGIGRLLAAYGVVLAAALSWSAR